MAIYKPASCYPFAGTFDVTDVPQYLECRIDTSNIPVTGYAIKILNEDNKQVFPVDQNGNPVDIKNNISPIEELKNLDIPSEGYVNLNTGLNGSYLKIPFFQKNSQKILESLNAIYFIDVDTSTPATTQAFLPFLEGVERPRFVGLTVDNGNSYKWQIYLFQGTREKKNSQNENLSPRQATVSTTPYYSDMQVASGQILGSDRTRIQTKPSDNILIDRYIQVYKEDKTAIDHRIRIKNYDSTYGYIYPDTTSGFANDTIVRGNAKYFKIFKNSNDPQILSPQAKVAYVADDLPEARWDNLSNRSRWIQTYYIPLRDNTIWGSFATQRENLETAAPKAYCFKLQNNGTTVFASNVQGGLWATVGERVIINKTSDLPYNGIFNPSITIDKSETAPKTLYQNVTSVCWKVTVTWDRDSTADTWGELVQSVNYVEGGFVYQGQTLQVEGGNSTISETVLSGRLNQTNVVFIPEEGTNLYDGGTSGEEQYGEIYYNDFSQDNGTPNEIYIRPAVNISAGMLFKKQNDFYNIIDVNTEKWYISLQEDINNKGFAINDKYSINTSFRSSDENPFNLKKNPKITILTGKFLEEGQLTSRDFVASATYETSDYYPAPWQSFRWVLNNKGQTVADSGSIYSGNIEYQFTGLANGEYTLTLSIQNYDGVIQETFVQFETNFKSSVSLELSEGSQAFNCDQTAVQINFSAAAYIQESPQSDPIEDAANGEIVLNSANSWVKYDKTSTDVGSAGVASLQIAANQGFHIQTKMTFGEVFEEENETKYSGIQNDLLFLMMGTSTLRVYLPNQIVDNAPNTFRNTLYYSLNDGDGVPVKMEDGETSVKLGSNYFYARGESSTQTEPTADEKAYTVFTAEKIPQYYYETSSKAEVWEDRTVDADENSNLAFPLDSGRGGIRVWTDNLVMPLEVITAQNSANTYSFEKRIYTSESSKSWDDTKTWEDGTATLVDIESYADETVFLNDPERAQFGTWILDIWGTTNASGIEAITEITAWKEGGEE